MDFDFNDQQYMFQKSVRDCLADTYALDAIRDGKEIAALDSGLWPKLAELGLFALLVPEQHGGLGLDYLDLALIIEEFGRALAPQSAVDTMAATDVLQRFGSPEQLAAWMPALAEGKARLACALYESGSGFDVADITCTARADGSGWVLDGEKIMVAFADRADRILIAARFAPGGAIGLLMLEPGRAGVTLTPHETLDLSNAFSRVTLSGVAVTAQDLVGGAGNTAAVVRLVDVLTTSASLAMVGISSRLLEIAVDYAKQRVQFDKPIGAFQAIKHKCADMAVAINGSRSSAYFAAWAVANAAPESPRAIAMAKASSGDTAQKVSREAIQIHGGMGFTWELGIHFYTRRAKVLETSYGTADFHRERVLAETLKLLDSTAV